MAIEEIRYLKQKLVKSRTAITGTKEFMVVFDALDEDNATDVLTASWGTITIPVIDDPFSADFPGVICTDIDIENTDAQQRIFRVMCGFSTLPPTDGGTPEDPAPLPPSVSRGTQESYEPANFDKDTKAILNSAKQLFDPPIQKRIADPIAVVRRRFLGILYDWSQTVLFMNSVNSTPFTLRAEIIAPRQAMITGWTDEEVEFNGVRYIDQTITISLREETWDVKVVDQGTMKLDGAGNSVAIKDSDGVPITAPIKLNGAGQPLTGSTEVLLTFRVYKERDFNALGLPEDAWV